MTPICSAISYFYALFLISHSKQRFNLIFIRTRFVTDFTARSTGRFCEGWNFVHCIMRGTEITVQNRLEMKYFYFSTSLSTTQQSLFVCYLDVSEHYSKKYEVKTEYMCTTQHNLGHILIKVINTKNTECKPTCIGTCLCISFLNEYITNGKHHHIC